MYFVSGLDKVRTAPTSNTKGHHTREGYMGRSRNYVYKPQQHSYYSKVNMLKQKPSHNANEHYEEPVNSVPRARRPAPQRAVKGFGSTPGSKSAFKIVLFIFVILAALVYSGVIKLPFKLKM